MKAEKSEEPATVEWPTKHYRRKIEGPLRVLDHQHVLERGGKGEVEGGEGE